MAYSFINECTKTSCIWRVIVQHVEDAVTCLLEHIESFYFLDQFFAERLAES